MISRAFWKSWKCEPFTFLKNKTTTIPLSLSCLFIHSLLFHQPMKHAPHVPFTDTQKTKFKETKIQHNELFQLGKIRKTLFRHSSDHFLKGFCAFSLVLKKRIRRRRQIRLIECAMNKLTLMVKEERNILKSRSFHFRKMFDLSPGSKVPPVSVGESEIGREDMDGKMRSRSEGAILEAKQLDSFMDKLSEQSPVSRLSNDGHEASASGSGSAKKERISTDLELMKERFSKLLLGEDMSGGGKGVSSALALSNAITNLAASVFGEQSKLEPMAPERKARWKKETDWLLSVTDYVVELVPSQQKAKDGTSMEIMVTQQRRDLLMNIPALRKLDTMLLGILDNFETEQEYWYISKDADESERGVQRNGKWWLPTVKVPPNGLSDDSRYFLQKQKEAVSQVLKASMAINAQTLSDMMIPENYIESLPKNGRSSLGDSIYKSITIEFFDPLQFLSTMDMSSEHKVLDLKNRIEASIVIWKRKMNHKDNKSTWGSAVSLEKRELFEERAETILLLLKQKFPGLPQSSLEISKIQYNKDVGLSILESYSRVLESLANTVMSCIEDVLYADSLGQDPSLASMDSTPSPVLSTNSLAEDEDPLPDQQSSSAPDHSSSSATGTPTAMTLSDFMGWNLENSPHTTDIKKNKSMGNLDSFLFKEDDENTIMLAKPGNVSLKKFAFVDKIDLGLRSPTSRH